MDTESSEGVGGAENAHLPYVIRYEGGRRLVERKVTTTDAGEVTIQHDFPDALAHYYSPGEVNEAINLYRGQFSFDGEEGRPYEGQLSMEWYPSPGIQARGERESGYADLLDFASKASSTTGSTWVDMPRVALPMQSGGCLPPQPTQAAASWTRQPLGRYRHEKLGPQVHGDEQGIDRVTFLIPNGWIALDGTGVCDHLEPVVTWYGRLQVLSGDWEITVDQRRGVSSGSFSRKLKQSGGYYVTHIGEIRRQDGARFDYSEVDWILETIRLCCTLMCGRSVSLVLPVGWRGPSAVMSEWYSGPIDAYRSVSTWRDESISAQQFQRLLECMLTYCATGSRREAVRYAISYYATANFDLDVELMVAVPVSGLQLLAYFRLVEEGRLSPKEFNARTTEEQLRRLLDDCSVDTTTPNHLRDLAKVAASVPIEAGDPAADALRTVIYLRNKITHPTKQKPGTWDLYGWAEAATASKHFLVMAILNTVGYNGQYHSIMSLERGLGFTSPVPWAPAGKTNQA